MSVRYVIHKKYRLIHTIGEDSITAAEVQAHQDQLLSDPAFDPSFNQLIDVTTALQLDITVAEAKEIARRRIVSANARRAFAARTIHMFVLGRLMEIYHEAHHEVDVHIFDDRDEALKWLGMPENSGLY